MSISGRTLALRRTLRKLQFLNIPGLSPICGRRHKAAAGHPAFY